MPEHDNAKGEEKLVYWILGFFGSIMILVLSYVVSSSISYKAGIDSRINALEVQNGITSSNNSEIQRRLVRIEDKIDSIEKNVRESKNQ